MDYHTKTRYKPERASFLCLIFAIIILPWFTLPLLNKDEIKRYMPVALLGSLIATIVAELAVSLNWWIGKDNIFPFHSIAPYIYGAFPVGIIWIFKFTKKNFVVFMLVNAVFDFVFSYLILRYTAQSGILAVPDLKLFVFRSSVDKSSSDIGNLV